MLLTGAWISFLSCTKNRSSSHIDSATGYKIRTIAIKPEGWLPHPYITGPSEEPMFYSLPIVLDTAQNYRSENIIDVTVKSTGLILYEAPPWYTFQSESGYLYELNRPPGSVVFWWIQKSQLTVPDADSAFVSFQY